MRAVAFCFLIPALLCTELQVFDGGMKYAWLCGVCSVMCVRVNRNFTVFAGCLTQQRIRVPFPRSSQEFSLCTWISSSNGTTVPLTAAF